MNNEEKLQNQKREQDIIEESGGITAESKGERIHCMSIIGQIEGHYTLPDGQKATKYEHIVPLLFSIEQSEDVDGLLIILNTMGGDVEAGLAIAELVASMKKPTVSLVLGGGHSIGVPLAVCAKKSFIVPSATMTIHPVRINGTVVGSPQTFYYFEKMQERITKFVCDHSGIFPDKFKSLMMCTDQIATDTGSIIDGHEATGCGLIDQIGGLSDAIESLKEMIGKNKQEL